jgi:hypothetical protein
MYLKSSDAPVSISPLPIPLLPSTLGDSSGRKFRERGGAFDFSLNHRSICRFSDVDNISRVDRSGLEAVAARFCRHRQRRCSDHLTQAEAAAEAHDALTVALASSLAAMAALAKAR